MLSTTVAGASLQAGEGLRDVKASTVQEKRPIRVDTAWQAGGRQPHASLYWGRLEACFGFLSSTLRRAVHCPTCESV